jgi:uncharacterized protein (DUF885 family)
MVEWSRKGDQGLIVDAAVILLLGVSLCLILGGDGATEARAEDCALDDSMKSGSSPLGNTASRFSQDWRALNRRYDAVGSPQRRQRLRSFLEEWNQSLAGIDRTRLGIEGNIDRVLLKRRLAYELYRIDREEQRFAEIAKLLPFAEAVWQLHESRREMKPIAPQGVADMLEAMRKSIDRTHDLVRKSKGQQEESTDSSSRLEVSRTSAHRAGQEVRRLSQILQHWFEHLNRYDPLFTWWVSQPHEAVQSALNEYHSFLREEAVGSSAGSDPPVVGDPIGREALLKELELELIPYSPEELIKIGWSELAWCERELRKAAHELGFGDDPLAAIEHVKGLHVKPGEQPRLIWDLAHEAVAFLEERDLLTIPPLAKEVWRIEMMSPERQKVNPFFTGGEVISVSFPTDTMSHADKLMSMRGNNPHFARATVHHELIPGHHLQGFMGRRYFTHRQELGTPFWLEGWALYWELKLWDLGFPKSPEDRVGMLFWRMHRCARIVFSLSFHLGLMSPDEAIGLLVNRVGHERANAVAEVRRSFEGSYPPLYQAAYLLGGLQIRALAQELVGTQTMTEKELHDAVIRGGSMPIELVRYRLKGESPPLELTSSWRFME